MSLPNHYTPSLSVSDAPPSLNVDFIHYLLDGIRYCTPKLEPLHPCLGVFMGGWGYWPALCVFATCQDLKDRSQDR